MSTEITIAPEAYAMTTPSGADPFSHLPEALRIKVMAARQSIQDSAVLATKKIGVKVGGTAYKFPDDTYAATFAGIIVAVKHANKDYPAAYVAGKVTPADCVAVKLDGDAKNLELAPIAEVATPYADDCSSCPRMQWGSNPLGTGRGKLCTEYTLLAVYVPALGDELFLLEEKKARAQQIDTYLRRVTEKFGHPVAVLTQFTINYNANAFEQNFEAIEAVEPELMAALADRIQEAESMLVASVKNSLANGEDNSIALEDTAGSSGRKARAR